MLRCKTSVAQFKTPQQCRYYPLDRKNFHLGSEGNCNGTHSKSVRLRDFGLPGQPHRHAPRCSSPTAPWAPPAAPSGASTGKFEAIELRDRRPAPLTAGKGVLKAPCAACRNIISPALEKVPSLTVRAKSTHVLCKLDGTPNQGPPGGQRHAGCVHGGGPGHRRPLPHAPVPVFGRGRGLPAAPAHDEHFKTAAPTPGTTSTSRSL